jgi:hypothetical protein
VNARERRTVSMSLALRRWRSSKRNNASGGDKAVVTAPQQGPSADAPTPAAAAIEERRSCVCPIESDMRDVPANLLNVCPILH